MTQKKHLLGSLVSAAMLAASLAPSFAFADAGTAPAKTFSQFVSGTTPWSLGTKDMLTNDFIEEGREVFTLAIKNSVPNDSKFVAYSAIMEDFMAIRTVSPELRWEKSFTSLHGGDVVLKKLKKEWLAPANGSFYGGESLVNCIDGCMDNRELRPLEVYPAMTAYRVSVQKAIAKVSKVTDRKKLEALAASLEKQLKGKKKMANKKYAPLFFSYWSAKERLSAMK